MHFDVLTIFPELFDTFRSTGVLGKAVERGVVSLEAHDLREWAHNKWRQLDDEPYGGGAGMVLQAPPILEAVREVASDGAPARIFALGPRGRAFDQAFAEELAAEQRLVMLCGRYEGIDERVFEIGGVEEVSLGDFILGGGEVAAMAVVEAVARLVPGVVGDPDSVVADSFVDGLLDHPCYTRPPNVEGRPVPEVLTSGNHEAVRRWRLERAVEATVTRRPDLINKNWQRLSTEVRAMVHALDPEMATELENGCRQPTGGRE